MADPFSLATGVISLVVITLNAIAGVSRMLDKTIAVHRDADEELERLRGNLEVLQGRMESNHGRLEALASDTKDRGFKKVLQSDAGQAAVVRLCQALKDTQNTLKRLTDQTGSEEATLRANVLPSKKRSLAFVRAVLKYNVSPQTIDEMISNLRQMQTEIQDCLRNLETSFNDVDNLHDRFHQQLERFSTYSHLSTSTTLPDRVQLVSFLEELGERREFSQRSQNEESKLLRTFLHAKDGDTSSTESLLDSWVSLTPPPLPSRPLPITVPNTVPLYLNGLNPHVRVKAAQQGVPPQHPKSDAGTGGRNVNHFFVPPKSPLTDSDARKLYPSSHSRLHVPMRPPVPTRPPPTPPQSGWAKQQQLIAAKLHEWQAQVAAAGGVRNITRHAAKNSEEIQKAMEKYLKPLKDLLRDRGGEPDEVEQFVNGSAISAHSGDDEEEPEGDELAEVEERAELRGFDCMELAMNGQEPPDPYVEIPGNDSSSDASPPAPPPTENDEDYRAALRRINMRRSRDDRALAHTPTRHSHSQLHVLMRPPVPMRPPPIPPESDWAKHQQLFAVKLRELQTQAAALEEEFNRALGSAKSNEEIQKAMKKDHNRVKDLWGDRGGELDELEQSDNDDENPLLVPPRLALPPSRPVFPLPPPRPVLTMPVPYRLERDSPAAAAAPKKRRHRGRPTNPEDNMLVDPFVFTLAEGKRYDVVEKVTARKKSVQPEPQFPTYREDFTATARTNVLRAQEEAEARERGRQEGSMLRRGASLVYRRHSPEPSAARVERAQRWVPSPPLNNEEKDLWRNRRGELNEVEQSDNDDKTSPAPSPVPPRPVRIKPIPAARDVPHRHDSPPAAPAAPMKRRHRHRGQPTDPEDNMLVDPFVFTITEGTRYDTIEKVTAGKKNAQPELQSPTYRESFTAIINAFRVREEAEARGRGRQEDSMLHRGGSLVLRRRRHSPLPGPPRGSPEPSTARVERMQRWATPPPLNNEGLKELRDLWRDRRTSLDELEQSDNDDENQALPPVSFRSVLTTMPLTKVDPIARVERTQRWMPPQNTNSDSGTGGSPVNHYFVPPNGPQTGPDALKPSTSIHSRLHVPMRPPVPTRPLPAPPQSDWAKQQQLIAVKLHGWQTQVAAAEGELNITRHAAKNNEEIQKAMEKYQKDLLRDRGGESDEVEKFVNGSAISLHSGDDEEEPEGGELAEVEERTELRGFDCMELVMNEQESPNLEVEIPGSDDPSDTPPPAPPPKENDEGYRAAQRRINMQSSRGERILFHGRAELTPATGGATPTRSSPTNIATPLYQSPSHSKVSSFLSSSGPATPIQPAAPLSKGDSSLSRAKSPRLRPETPTLNPPTLKPPDNLNWRQIIEGSLQRVEHWSCEYVNFDSSVSEY